MLAATSATGLQPSRLFYLTEQDTDLRFLIDTGAQVSVIPPTSQESKHPRTDLTLQAVNDTPIPTFGLRSLPLKLGLRRTFRWVFIIADTTTPGIPPNPSGAIGHPENCSYYIVRTFRIPAYVVRPL